MANTTFQLRRSSVAGKVPNTSTLSIGELGLNLTDKILYSSDGTNIFEIGANNTNVNISGNLTVKAIKANGSLGTSGQTLTSNGSAVYWSAPTAGDITGVAAGNGLTGGGTSGDVTVSVLANTGIVANATGVYVNAAYINTISSNSATYANASKTNTFTVGTGTFFVSNGNVGIGTNITSRKLTIAGNSYYNYVQSTDSNYTQIESQYILSNVSHTSGKNNIGYYGISRNDDQWLNADGVTRYSASTFGILLDLSNGHPINGGDAYMSNLVGSRVQINNYANGSSNNSISTAIGHASYIRTYSSGKINTAYALRGDIYPASANSTVTGNIDTAYGTFINLGLNSSNASIGTGYLYYGGYQTSANVTSKWGIYLNNETSNYLSGNTGLGNNVPAHKLSVNGTTYLQANLTLNAALVANGGAGSAGQVLHSNGSATYWDTDDQGVTSVGTGNGLTGGTITTTGSISVLANTGIVANATGLYVNAAYIGTLAANSATYLGGNTASDLITYADNKAANAYSNAVSYVDGKSYVNTSQLSSNLANYQTSAGLSSNVATLTSNNSTYAFGKPEGNLNVNSAVYANSSSTNTFTVGTGTYFVSNGNVGIGNTAPAHKLSVNGLSNFVSNVTITGLLTVNGNTTSQIVGGSTSSSVVGVLGYSNNSYGVQGSSTSSAGVVGISSSSYGVQGSTTSGIGIYGVSAGSEGVYGYNSNTGVGTRGYAAANYAVYGQPGNNSYGGVIGYNQAGSAYGICGYQTYAFYGNGDLLVTGSISKGSGSFRIDHPLPSMANTHYLVHSFVEAPTADNIYRGKIKLVGGVAEVNLDNASFMTEGTFTALNGNLQVFLQNDSGWAALKGSITGNILKVVCQDATSTDTVSWIVIGTRQDKTIIESNLTDEFGNIIIERPKSFDPVPLEPNLSLSEPPH